MRRGRSTADGRRSSVPGDRPSARPSAARHERDRPARDGAPSRERRRCATLGDVRVARWSALAHAAGFPAWGIRGNLPPRHAVPRPRRLRPLPARRRRVALAHLRRPGRAIAAAAEAVEQAAEQPLRTWWRRAADPEMATGLALTRPLGAVIVGRASCRRPGLPRARQLRARSDRLGRRRIGVTSTRRTPRRACSTGSRDLGDAPIVIDDRGRARRRTSFGDRPAGGSCRSCSSSTLGDQLITKAIKELADRARPTLNPLAATLGPSFPSGHSSTAAGLLRGARAGARARAQSPHVQAWLAGAAVAIAVAVAQPGAARRALGLRCHRRPLARLGLVRALRDRVRRPAHALRRADGARRRSRRPHPPRADLKAARRTATPPPAEV